MPKNSFFTDPTDPRNSNTTNNTTNESNPFFSGDLGRAPENIPFHEAESTGVDREAYSSYLGEIFPITSTIDKDRAINQSGWEQLGRTAAKIVPKIGLEFLNQLGNVLDVEDWFNSDDEISNWLSRDAIEGKEKIDAALPVYETDPGKAMNIGDSAWWYNRGSSLVESIVAFVGLGYVTGGASMGLFRNGAKMLNVLKGLGAGAQLSSKSQQTVRGLSSVANNFLLNRAESIGIGADVYNQTYSKILAETGDEALAKKEASNRASLATNFNLINMLVNHTSATAFLKTNRLTRQLRKQPTIANTARKTIGEGVQESVEESVNLIAEKLGLNPDGSFEDITGELFTAEGLESALLGFIGGAGQTSLTAAGRNLKIRKDDAGNRVSQNDLDFQAYERQQQNIKDIEKADYSSMDAFLRQEEVNELYNDINVLAKKRVKTAEDTARLEELKGTMLYNQSFDAFNNGTTEQLISSYEAISKLSPEEAKNRGFDSTYKEQSLKAVDTIKTLEDSFENSRTYFNSNKVYENRVFNTHYKNTLQEYNEGINRHKTELIDALNLENIDLDTAFNEKGEVKSDVENLVNKYPAYDTLVQLEQEKKNILKKYKATNTEYANLTSKETQSKLKNDFARKKAIKESLERDLKAAKKRAETEAKKTKNSKKVKDTEEKKAKEKKTSGEITYPFSFKFTPVNSTKIDPLVDKLNNMLTKNKSYEYIKKKFEEYKTGINNAFPNNIDPKVQGFLIQLENALKLANTNIESASKKQEVSDSSQGTTQEFFDNLSPEEVEDVNEKTKQDISNKIDSYMKFVEKLQAEGIDTSDFDAFSEFILNAIGQDLFEEKFYSFRALFNLANPGANIDTTFDSFRSEEERINIIERKTIEEISNLINDYTNSSAGQIEIYADETLRAILAQEGYTVYESENVSTKDIVKIKVAYNKFAYLAKKYDRIIGTKKVRFNVIDFNIRKEDIDKYLNEELDEKIVSRDGLQVGDEVTFKVMDEVVYEDGTVINKNDDGTYTVEKQGEEASNVTIQDAVDVAPIAIFHNGKQVKGAYMHLPTFFNKETIADSKQIAVQIERNKLIRKAIIDAGEKSTTITKMTPGHILKDVNNPAIRMSKALPEAGIGVGSDGKILTENEVIKIPNYKAKNALPYIVVPARNGSLVAHPFYTSQLNAVPKYVDSIVNAIRMYMVNRPTQATQEIKQKTGINILSTNGLELYLDKLLYLSPNKYQGVSRKSFTDFKSLLENSNDRLSVIRIVGDNIDFGKGLDNVNVARLNREIYGTKDLDSKLEILKNVLNHNMRLKVNQNLLGTDFVLPVIKSETEVEFEEKPYNDFIKENSFTQLYSIELESGEQVYTVQSNISFDTEAIVGENLPELSEKDEEDDFEEFIGESTGDDITDSIIDGDIGDMGYDTFDTEDDFIGLSPIELDEEQENLVNKQSFEKYHIPGLNINLQETLLKDIAANVIELTINNINESSVNNATNFVNSYLNKLRNNRDKYSKIFEELIVKAKASNDSDTVFKYETQLKNLTSQTNIILNNWNTVLQLLSIRLNNKYGIVSSVINREYEVTNDKGEIETRVADKKILKIVRINVNKDDLAMANIHDEEVNSEEDSDETKDASEKNNWGKDSFTENPKRSISTGIKNLLSTIIKTKKVKTKSGEIKTRNVLSAILIPERLDAEDIVNELFSILSYNGSNESAMLYTFDEMMDVLESYSKSSTHLEEVIKVLKNTNNKIKNEFVQSFGKHYNNHVYVSVRKDEYKVRASDNNSIIKNILSIWLNNLKYSKLINKKGGEYTFSKEEVDNASMGLSSIRKLLSKESALKPADYIKVQRYLKSIGFNITRRSLYMLNKGYLKNKKGEPLNLSDLFSSKNVFGIYVTKIKGLVGKGIYDYQIFGEPIFYRFASTLAKIEPKSYAKSFKDVKGKLYFAYSNNKFLTDRVHDLKNDEALLKSLLAQPYSANSSLVKDLMNDEKAREVFNYFTVDGISAGNSAKPDSSSYKELEQMKIALFFEQFQQGAKYRPIINLFYPTTSNKPVIYGIKMLGKKYSNYIENNKLTNQYYNSIIEAVVVPEVQRILDFEKNNTNAHMKNAEISNRLFYNIPSLNAIKELKEDGKLKADVLTNPKTSKLIRQEVRKMMSFLIQEKLDTWKDLGLITTKETAEGKKYNTVHNNMNPREAAVEFVTNYLVSNVNMFQAFTTDLANYYKSSVWKDSLKIKKNNDGEIIPNPALDAVIDGELINDYEEAIAYYKAMPKNERIISLMEYFTENDWRKVHDDVFNNLGKRLGADAGPGTIIPDSNNNHFTLGIIADREVESDYKEYFNRILSSIGKSYGDMNGTDAQELTTLKEHLYLLVKKGAISQEKADEIIKKDNKYALTGEDAKEVLQPMKPIYAHNVFINGKEHRIYVKSSSFPLTKTFTKGLPINKVRLSMEKQGIDRLAYESAVKIGGLENPTQIFNADGKINGKKLTVLNDGKNPVKISRRGFKIQQEVPYKEDKTHIKAGTQEVILLTANMLDIDGFRVKGEEGTFTGSQIRNKIDDVVAELYKLNYNELVKELGYNESTNTIKPYKLERLLRKEGIKRDYSLKELAAIKIMKNEDGTFTFKAPLWGMGLSSKIQALLNSIVDNRIRKIKLPGSSDVLGSSEGIVPVLEGQDAEDYIAKNNTKIVWDKEWYAKSKGKLSPMLIKDANGLLKGEDGFDESTAYVSYAEIIIPFKFKDSKGNTLYAEDFTKDGFINPEQLPEDVLKMFGYRIPTQYFSSMAAIKVVGFTPKSVGDLVLAPSEWTIKMGSDFDVDKLYSYMYNIHYNEGNNSVSLYNGKNKRKLLENKLLDLHFSIFGNPNPKVQALIAAPLDFGDLIDLANEIYDDTTTRYGISESYQNWKYLNAREGKTGIGSFSSDNILLALMERKGIKFQQQIGKEYEPLKYRIGGYTNNGLSTSTINKPNSNKTKMQVNIAFQSLTVDDENEQGLHKLNINEYTFDIIRALVADGFDEDVIIKFINQPIIKDFVYNKKKNKHIRDYNYDEVIKGKLGLTTEFIQSIDDGLVEHIAITEMEYLNSEINKPLEDTNTDNQYAIYRLFKKLSNYGVALKTVQSSLNPHSAGFGKDLFYSVEKENQVLKLRKNALIENVDNLVGHFHFVTDAKEPKAGSLTDRWKKADNNGKKAIVNKLKEEGYFPLGIVEYNGMYANTPVFLKPNNIKGYAIAYALNFNNKLWSNYFPYNNAKVVQFSKLYKKLHKTGSSLTQQAEANKKAFDIIKRYLASNSSLYTDGDIVSERQRLFYKTETNDSIAYILHNIVQSTNYSNPFINRLNPALQGENEISTVTYDASKSESIDETDIYNSIEAMLKDNNTLLGVYNGIEYSPRKLVQDLISYSLLENGIQSNTNFIKYIPHSYLEATGYYNYLNNFNFNKLNPFLLLAQEIQNNPETVLLNEEQQELFDNLPKFHGDNLITYDNSAYAVLLGNIFSVSDEGSPSGYRLYKKVENSNSYKAIPTVGNGTNTLFEFDFNRVYATSMLQDNNPSNRKIDKVIDRSGLDKIFTNKPVEKKNKGKQIKTTNSFLDNYNLKEDTSSREKVASILTNLSLSNDAYVSYFSKALLNNIDKFNTLKINIVNNANYQGAYSANTHSININPNKIKDEATFQKVILEELIHSITVRELAANPALQAKFNIIRQEAINATRLHFANNDLGNFDSQFEAVKQKVKDFEENQAPYSLTKIEREYLYPLVKTTEFIARLPRSKELREVLNNSTTETKSILEKIFDFFVDILNSFGLDIRKGSLLDTSVKEVLGYIHLGNELKGKNLIANRVTVEKVLGITNQDNQLNEFKTEEAKIIAETVNQFDNLKAQVVDNFVVVEDITFKDVKTTIKGENISSKGSEFAKKLTNPGNDLGITLTLNDGKQYKFRNAEHAYQSLKSGTLDIVAYKSTAFKPKGNLPVNKNKSLQIMTDIIAAKLQQHPELIKGINERGGIKYLNNSTHEVTGDKFWEKDGNFIKALTDAYNAVQDSFVNENKIAEILDNSIGSYQIAQSDYTIGSDGTVIHHHKTKGAIVETNDTIKYKVYGAHVMENYLKTVSFNGSTYSRLNGVIFNVKTGKTVTQKQIADLFDVKKESKKKSKEKITYEDLNEGQKKAYKEIEEFLNDRSRSTHSLIGYAGTGKTTLLNVINDNIISPYETVVYSSPTHRANSVMKLKMPNEKVVTLHSLLGLIPGQREADFDVNNVSFEKGAESKLKPTILIIDEASMIDDFIFNELQETFKGKIKILFVGDDGQLPPPGQEHDSKALTSTEKVSKITEVMRAKNNTLLNESMLVREKGNFTYTNNDGNEGVKYTNNSAEFKKDFIDLLKSEEFKNNPLLARMLSADNKTVDVFNSSIKKILFGKDYKEFEEGEILMGYSNWGRDYQTEQYIIQNSGDYKVISNTETTRVVGNTTVKGWNLIVKNILNSEEANKELFVISEENFQKDLDGIIAYHEDIIARANKARRNRDFRNSARLFNEASEYLNSFATNTPLSYKGKVKVKRTFKPGYVHTIHKSQGGTYNEVFILDNTIDSFGGQYMSPSLKKKTSQRLKYVSVTRAENISHILTNRRIYNQKEVEAKKIKQAIKKNPKVQAIKNSFTNHSGGAYGGDTFWDLIGRNYGFNNHNHYKNEGDLKVSKTLKDKNVTATPLSKEEMEFARNQIKEILGVYYEDNYTNNLKIRNFYQVAKSDGVYAIAHLQGNKVKGGTDVAVQLGIKLDKLVYVWDIDTEKWYKYDKNSNRFKETPTPVLTKNYAGVGSRDIQDYKTKDNTTGKFVNRSTLGKYVGKNKSIKASKAIKAVYSKTENAITKGFYNDNSNINETGQSSLNLSPEETNDEAFKYTTPWGLPSIRRTTRENIRYNIQEFIQYAIEEGYNKNLEGARVYSRRVNELFGEKVVSFKIGLDGVIEASISIPNSIVEKYEASYDVTEGYLNDNLSSEEIDFDSFETEEIKRIDQSILLEKVYKARAYHLEKIIDKARSKGDNKRVLNLREQLAEVNEKANQVILADTLLDKLGVTSDIFTKGKQDIQEIKEMLSNDVWEEDTLYAREVLDFWSKAIEVLLNSEERNNDIILKEFANLQNDAILLRDKLEQIEIDFMNNMVKDNNGNLTVDEIFENFTDISSFTANALDIGRSGNELLDAVLISYKNANIDAREESEVIVNKINELEEKILPILKQLNPNAKTTDELFDVFRQKTKKGNFTGHIVSAFNVDFIKEYKEIIRTYSKFRNNSDSDYGYVIGWAHNNLKNIDLKLFESKTNKGKKYRESLEKEMGSTIYKDFEENQTRLLKNYKALLKDKISNMAKKAGISEKEMRTQLSTNEEYRKQLANWNAIYSPYQFYKFAEKSDLGRYSNYKNFRAHEYVHFIPKEKEHYDTDFANIAKDEDLLEFYNYYREVDKNLKTYLPDDVKIELAYQGVPYVAKNILDLYKEKGAKPGLAAIWDNVMESVRTFKESSVEKEVINPVTNKVRPELGISLTRSQNVQEYVNRKSIEYRLNNNNNPDEALRKQWREEEIDRLSKNKSFNLAKILKVYAMQTLAYKHKAKIEDSILIAQNVLHAQQERIKNNFGEDKIDEEENIVAPMTAQNSFKNTKLQFDYFVDKFLGIKNPESNTDVTKMVKYTQEEKEIKQEYEHILEQARQAYENEEIDVVEYEIIVDRVQNSINNLGGNLQKSKVGDGLLKWVQLVKMGWNVMSGFANVGFGYIANRIEAAGGRVFTDEQLTEAYKLTSNSVLKNATFNMKQTPMAIKIRTLMNDWDILKDASHEMYEHPLDINLGKRFNWLSPYNVTQRTEYVNQAPIMIAIMMNTQLKDVGVDAEGNLWDAYKLNGKWDSEKYGEITPEIKKKINFVKMIVDRQNSMNHGNYDPDAPIKAKEKFINRALLQFRTWIIEGVASRVQSERPDAFLGTRKGRYISMVDAFKQHEFTDVAKSIMKGLTRRLTMGKTFKNHTFEDLASDTFKDIDVANMRKVMSEMAMLLNVSLAYTTIQMAKADLDDDDPKKYMLNLLTNQGLRLRTDILFYIHPQELRNLLRDPLPVTSLIKDYSLFVESVVKVAKGEDEIKAGVYSGNSNIARRTVNLFPFGTQMYKSYSYTIQSFDK